MPNPPKSITLRDVARLAGVSYQTVSRVINNSPNVANKTRSRVLRVMHDLDYRPNQAAKMLRTQRSYMIEVIALDMHDSGVGAFKAMAYRTRQRGYQLLISTLTDETEFANTVLSARSRLVDGLVISQFRASSVSTDVNALSLGIPIVRMGGEIGDQNASVIYDHVYGGYLAMQHLIALGHTRIATIEVEYGYDSHMRRRGAQMALREAGLAPGPCEFGTFWSKTGFDAMNRILNSKVPFTAVFAHNDDMAIGAIDALVKRGLRVPDDISVVGYDDIAIAPFAQPNLTTVHFETGALGELTVEYLISLIEKPDTPSHQRVLRPELVVRSSTKDIRDS